MKRGGMPGAGGGGQVATPPEYAAAHFAERLLLVPGSFFVNEYAARCGRGRASAGQFG